MSIRTRILAVVLAGSSATAFAAGNGAASVDSSHAYESCLTARALALELTGIEVHEVVTRAERDCSAARGALTNAAASEISQKVRLAVMQQRSDARNTLRRG